jgi:putative peptidoglycan lipid II flippase
MSENSQMVRAAGVVGLGTLGSRILGFIRDMVTAFFFGATDAADAFFVAFTIPNLLRRLFAEGTMTVAVIPVYTETLIHEGKQEAVRVARITMTFMAIVLTVCVLAGILFSPEILTLFAAGFRANAPKWELTVLLTRVMFPYMLLISLAALAMGVLNSMGHFFAPSASPMLFNLAMILAMLIISPLLNVPVMGLAIGVVIGGILMVALQVPFLIRNGVTFRPDFHFSHPRVKTILKLMVPAIFGASIYQVNVVVVRLLASFLPSGSVSYLYYADRLDQFPLGIFAVALGTAVLPTMSRMAAENRIEDLKRTFIDALSMTLYITIPAALGLAILSVPIISALFFRGEFDFTSVVMTANALVFFALGLPFVASIRVLSNGFYALKDTATPVKIGVVAIIVNILLSVILVVPMAHCGLALAVSLDALLNAVLLLVVFRRIMGRLGLKRLLLSMIRMGVGCLTMGAAAWWIASLIHWDTPGRTTEKAVVLTAAILGSLLVYLVTTRLLGARELGAIVGPFIKRFGNRGEPS